MTTRKTPGATFWATVVVVVGFVAYPLSSGPVCWVASWIDVGDDAVSSIYQPIFRFCWRGKMPDERDYLRNYLRLLAADGWDIAEPLFGDRIDEYHWTHFWLDL